MMIIIIHFQMYFGQKKNKNKIINQKNENKLNDLSNDFFLIFTSSSFVNTSVFLLFIHWNSMKIPRKIINIFILILLNSVNDDDQESII